VRLRLRQAVAVIVIGKRLTPVVAIATLFVACVTGDHTTDSYSGQFVNHCFVTLKEAIFVSHECWRGAWKYCDAVVPINPYPQSPSLTDYPPTLQAYRDSPDEWARRIHHFEVQNQPGAQPDRVTIYGGLPIGTTLRISQVLSKFDGENGRYWLTFAIVQNGEFKGRRLLLPRAAASVVNWQFLGTCDSSTRATEGTP